MNWLKNGLLCLMIFALLCAAASAAGWRMPATCSGGSCASPGVAEVPVTAIVVPSAAAAGTCSASDLRPIPSVIRAVIRGPLKAVKAIRQAKPARRLCGSILERQPVRRAVGAVFGRRK